MTKALTRIAATAAGLMLAAGAALVNAPSASALVSGSQHSVATGKCLGVYGNVPFDGTAAVIWGCNGNADQNWELTGTGGGYYQLQNGNSECLGIYSGDATQWNCNGHDDQQWYIDRPAGYSSAMLRSKTNWTLCLTVPGNVDGSRVTLATCAGQDNQLWY
ncbi:MULTISPECIES: RICIN domain-containing protein [Kitasatospora]|uniref:Ricin B lectin domain-containing protein n=1 Tax=Kitasatospora cystarginea TaxID=58350 RepID=A0ABN3DZ94_9ACTN